jgi:phosphopantetheinyl transferase
MPDLPIRLDTLAAAISERSRVTVAMRRVSRPSETDLAALSAEERGRATGFASSVRRDSFVAGRVALRTMLASQANGSHTGGSPVAPGEVELLRKPSGALRVGETGLVVSISHSGAWAAATVGERPHAIDLERLRTMHPRLASRILTPSERDTLGEAGVGVIEAWSIKEAALKARESGFRLAANLLRIDEIAADEIAADAGRAGSGLPLSLARVADPDGTRWDVWYGTAEGYVCTLAHTRR